MARRPRAQRVSFTTRGASLLAAGISTVGGAILLGETDLLRIAAALIALCLGCWIYLKVSGLRLHSRHLALPSESPVGAAMTIRIPLRIAHRLLLTDLVITDATSDGLTDGPSLGLDPRSASEGMTVEYQTSTRYRGMHTAGGISATMRDPFGIAEIAVRTEDTVSVLGLPRVHPIHPDWLRLPSADEGLEHAGAIVHLSEPDVDIREHRSEDGLRRVHWRTSARHGKLMVRPDEPVEDRSDLLVLDTRDGSHFGHSFESMIEIAASAGHALITAGHLVELRTWDGRLIGSRSFSDGAALLRTLAVAIPEPRTPDDSNVASGGVAQLDTWHSQRTPTLVVTTAAADPSSTPPVRSRSGALTVVLTSRTEPTATSRELVPAGSRLRPIAHPSRDPVDVLLAQPPVVTG